MTQHPSHFSKPLEKQSTISYLPLWNFTYYHYLVTNIVDQISLKILNVRMFFTILRSWEGSGAMRKKRDEKIVDDNPDSSYVYLSPLVVAGHLVIL